MPEKTQQTKVSATEGVRDSIEEIVSKTPGATLKQEEIDNLTRHCLSDIKDPPPKKVN